MTRALNLVLPLVGVVLAVAVWWGVSQKVTDLPSPMKTWEESKLYILAPLEKRGETDQGIALLAGYSLLRVARGFLLGAVIGTPLGFLFGVSPLLTRMFAHSLVSFVRGTARLTGSARASACTA